MKEKELQELEKALRAATSEVVPGDAGAVNALRDAAEAALPALLADLREAHAEEKLLRVALALICDVSDAEDGTDAMPRLERCIELAGRALCPGNAAPKETPPDSVSESLREARGLLQEARDALALFLLPPSNDAELLWRLDAFLGERSDRERSEPPAPPEDVEERK